MGGVKMPIIFFLVTATIGFFIGYHLVWWFYVLPVVCVLMFWDTTKGGLEAAVPVFIVYLCLVVILGMVIGDIAKHFDINSLSVFIDKG